MSEAGGKVLRADRHENPTGSSVRSFVCSFLPQLLPESLSQSDLHEKTFAEEEENLPLQVVEWFSSRFSEVLDTRRGDVATRPASRFRLAYLDGSDDLAEWEELVRRRSET